MNEKIRKLMEERDSISDEMRKVRNRYGIERKNIRSGLKGYDNEIAELKRKLFLLNLKKRRVLKEAYEKSGIIQELKEKTENFDIEFRKKLDEIDKEYESEKKK